MSILIKGMEMPFSCLSCDFRKCAGGVGDFCSLTKRRQFRFKNRPNDCPLVPVPKHGRLIDADAIRADIDEKRPGRSYEDAWALTVMDAAPTIIPAEEGET